MFERSRETGLKEGGGGAEGRFLAASSRVAGNSNT